MNHCNKAFLLDWRQLAGQIIGKSLGRDATRRRAEGLKARPGGQVTRPGQPSGEVAAGPSKWKNSQFQSRVEAAAASAVGHIL